MKKTTKGVLAAGAAVVLLSGGATTLAYWSDTGTADGGDVTTGSLSLSDGTCDDQWVYASGSAAGEAVTTIVPGDAVTKDCTFTVEATGDHLSAEVSVPDTLTYTADPAAASLELAVDGTYDVGGTPIVDGDVITEANDGQTLTASFVVSFPFGDAETININDTQNLTATLDALEVTLTQTQTEENPEV
ncbi:alternate-type signal peptide domain-containing protein [Georgenia deserti]|uniref:Alternate-type signal peptide domain-containing protein n=1 Tax=Georgenia deserti TaxID=2093781 RepID=A0ABW4L025_9MICO